MKNSTMPDEPSNELAEEMNKIFKRKNIDFSEAKEWFIKSGRKAEEVKKELPKKILEILSQYLSKGLLQLTIEEIKNEKEYTDAIRSKKDQALVMNLSKDLPAFDIYVETIIKSGSIEIGKFRYDFTVESKVEVSDAKIVIRKNKINNISFGSFSASITLSLLKGEQHIELGTIERSLSLGKQTTLMPD